MKPIVLPGILLGALLGVWMFTFGLAGWHKHPTLHHLFWVVVLIQAAVLSVLPGRLLTPDQLRQLAVDNVVAEGATGLADLGIAPTPAEAVLPTYLDRFRAGGQFARSRPAG